MANIKTGTRATCEAAIFIALSLALSYVRFKIWAQGGSVDLAMIPLIIFSLRWGAPWGIGASGVYGFLRCLILDGMVYGWQAIFLDYIIAYGCCGLAGLFRKGKLGAEIGAAVGCVCRFLAHLISGVVLWGSFMPSEYFGLSMNNVWVYSALYNGSYMLPSMILAIVIIAILKLPLEKYIRGEDIARA